MIAGKIFTTIIFDVVDAVRPVISAGRYTSGEGEIILNRGGGSVRRKRGGKNANVRRRGNLFFLPVRLQTDPDIVSGRKSDPCADLPALEPPSNAVYETVAAGEEDDTPSHSQPFHHDEEKSLREAADRLAEEHFEDLAAERAAEHQQDLEGVRPEGPQATAVRAPVQPTAEQRRQHDLTHLPCEDWCEDCVFARAPDAQHRRIDAEKRPTNVCQADYFFLNSNGERVELESQASATILSVVHVDSSAQMATVVQTKGPRDKKCTARFLEDIGEKNLVLQTDQENPILAWANGVKKEANCNIILQNSPLYSHASQGAVEAANRRMEEQIRIMKRVFDRNYLVVTTVKSPWFPWMVRQASWNLTTFQPRKGGQSSYSILYGHEYGHPVLSFGEGCVWRDPTDKKISKLNCRHGLGVWVGRAARSNEHLLLTPRGTVRARAVRRRIPSKQWDLLLLKEVRGLPWSPKEGVTSAEQADRIAEILLRGVRPEAQTVHEQATAAEEKQATDEQSAAGPGGAGTTTVPVDASDTSSSLSSSSDDAPAALAAPTPVAADLLRTQPDDAILANITELVCEEEIPPLQVEPEEWHDRKHENRMIELDKLEDFTVFQRVPVDSAKGKYILDGTWVDKVGKSRWAAREFNTFKSDDFFAPTPCGVCDHIIELIAAKRGWPMLVADVTSAYCHAAETEEVYMYPPQEDVEAHRDTHPKGFVWRLLRQLYGRRKAGNIWQDHLAEILESINFVRIMADPTFF